ncbi:sialidase family protein [Leifsonia poae]|uniref:sialidase family protein n=1 Tax=Leifsonia poae TaxID=110933 RepID=UPI003D6707CC
MPDLTTEIKRTRPDYTVFAPASTDPTGATTGNEHFLVEKIPGGGLIAVWTQSSIEGADDQHIVFARSQDEGETWSEARTIAGPDAATGTGMASWGFPLVSERGRIYVVFSRHTGVNDIYTHTTGVMTAIYSDDLGETWSQAATLDLPRSIWDNPDPAVPSNCIVWQKPTRVSDGKHFVGLTRWISPALGEDRVGSVVEFLRFPNVDLHPEPQDLQVEAFSTNEHALRLDGHVLQEPSIVPLPDGRLFCVMRSNAGSPFWSQSSDAGRSWSQPRPLLQHDDGPVMPHPLSPCPIYAGPDEEYAFFYHNHDGHFQRFVPADWEPHRRPICLARGRFRAGAEQPVWFSDPFYFMDSGGVKLIREGMSLYSSVTETEDGIVLWYPDRKFFLLGRRITTAELSALEIVDPAVPDKKFTLGVIG